MDDATTNDEFDDEMYGMEDDEIAQEEVWVVIDKYFYTKGLVGQQIDSFDEFIKNIIQEIVDDAGDITVTPEDQFIPGMDVKHYTWVIKFGQIYVCPPVHYEDDGEVRELYPQEARLRGLTYSAPVFIDIYNKQYELDENKQYNPDDEPFKERTYEQCLLCQLPLMLKSEYCILKGKNDRELTRVGECMFDSGGYFVINGSEKVMIAQERMANNHVYVFKKAQPHKHEWVCETRSHSQGARQPSTLFLAMYSSGPRNAVEGRQIRSTLPYIRQDIPIVIVFRALGLEKDKDIIGHVVYDFEDTEMMERLRPSLEEAAPVQNQIVALDYIGKRGNAVNVSRKERVQYARDILQKEALPHIGIEENNETKKAFYLGYIVHKMLMCSLGRLDEDDRDHFGKKRLDLAGALIGGLFRNLFKKLSKQVKQHLEKAVNEGREMNLLKAMDNKSISDGLRYSLATGNWGDKVKQDGKKGVVQVLNRLTFASALSHLRRCNAPFPKEGKLAKPRMLHSTHWGIVCPAETPEGQSVGLVKNLALMSSVSVGSSANDILEFLDEWGMENLNEIHYNDLAQPKTIKIFVNGNWVGIHRDPENLVHTLRTMRRQGDIGSEVSIVRDIKEKEIRVYTDLGRIMRPLLIVTKDQKLVIKKKHINMLNRSNIEMQNGGEETFGWRQLLESGVVEYIDTDEEETTMIAMKPDDCVGYRKARNPNHDEETDPSYCETYTHCEIHPSLILGICASIIPLPDHNQSPRNCYQSAMGKQAMGVYLSSFQQRLDTMAHLLHYPQKPLAVTRAMEHMQFRNLPSGINCIVAIACYTGYNQEDSLIMNQSSIDRGLFRSSFYRTYNGVCKQKPGVFNPMIDETFEVPTRDTCRGTHDNYDTLDVDGLADVGLMAKEDSVIIGKTKPYPIEGPDGTTVSYTRTDDSVCMRSNEKGWIDTVMLSTNKEGYKYAKVKIRNVRVPQIGDKFASRHGQKGTIGMTYRMEDLPYTCEGVVPDIIVNPHAIPSRMTVAHLVECLMSKVATLLGQEGDATPFMDDVNVEIISKELSKLGYQRHGNECLYNGHTGRPMDTLIFIGPTFYQRLKHMVDDKIHARSRGPVQMLTRQPLEGRAREGGLRMGEMERDCLISHGAANFLRDRLYANSDPYRVHVCDECGIIAVADLRQQKFSCGYCDNKTAFSQIHIPYAGKLLFQELMAMCILPRIFVDKPADTDTS